MLGDAAYCPGNRALRLKDIPVSPAAGCRRALAAPDQLIELTLADWQPSFVQFLDKLPSVQNSCCKVDLRLPLPARNIRESNGTRFHHQGAT